MPHNYSEYNKQCYSIQQVAVKREEAINREISKKMAEDKINKKEKDER